MLDSVYHMTLRLCKIKIFVRIKHFCNTLECDYFSVFILRHCFQLIYFMQNAMV